MKREAGPTACLPGLPDAVRTPPQASTSTCRPLQGLMYGKNTVYLVTKETPELCDICAKIRGILCRTSSSCGTFRGNYGRCICGVVPELYIVGHYS